VVLRNFGEQLTSIRTKGEKSVDVYRKSKTVINGPGTREREMLAEVSLNATGEMLEEGVLT